MNVWNTYFHFPTGTKFHVDGPWGYNGEGQVIENSDNRLVLRLDIDAWGPAPALHATITASYFKEGPGNVAIIEQDGQPTHADENATILSDSRRRERRITSRAATYSVRYENENEIDFDLYVHGRSFDFDLELQH